MVIKENTYTAAPKTNEQAWDINKVGRFSIQNTPLRKTLVLRTLNLWRRGCLKYPLKSLEIKNENGNVTLDITINNLARKIQQLAH